MNTLFYVAAAVAVGSAGMAITRKVAVHALLYLVVTYFAVALILMLIGAPFAAALELIVYAGAIVVMFVFVVMILNLGVAAAKAEAAALHPSKWIGPSLLGAVLLGEVGWMLASGDAQVPIGAEVDTKSVGIALWGPYLLAVELASMLLLSALIGTFHLGRRLHDTGRVEGA